MTEAIRSEYQASSESAVIHWEIPYDRMTDTTPTETLPAEVTSLTDSTQLTGTILTIDAHAFVATIDFTCGMVYFQEVRNVLTYFKGIENTWGAINIGESCLERPSHPPPREQSSAPGGLGMSIGTRCLYSL